MQYLKGGDTVAQTMLNVRINSEDKTKFEEFCRQTGLNISTCINMFIKAVLREQKLPFEVKADSAFEKESIAKNQIENTNATGDNIDRVPSEVD